MLLTIYCDKCGGVLSEDVGTNDDGNVGIMIEHCPFCRSTLADELIEKALEIVEDIDAPADLADVEYQLREIL